MRVLVTGGDGFIGRHVCQVLRDRNAQVTVFDRRYGQTVLNQYEVCEALKNQQAVIHLAGVLGTSELFEAPHAAIDVNIKGTVNVLLGCEQVGARYVGITMPDVWSNVYQATKRCAKELATAWHLAKGIPVSHVRAYNVFGEGQHYGSPQKIVPTFSVRAWRGEPLPIWGTGQQGMDLVHVSDVARMLCDALVYGQDQVFDAGTGTGTFVDEFASFVEGVTGSKGGREYLPMRPGEQPTYVPVARGEGWDALGWKPSLRIDELRATIESYRGIAERQS